MDEVKSILSVLENNKLTKTWSQGRGGPDRDYLTISYEYNDQKYEFIMHHLLLIEILSSFALLLYFFSTSTIKAK